MKIIFAGLFLFALNARAASTLCDLFGENEVSNITKIGVPNCITDDNIFNENDTPGSGPICKGCRDNLNSHVSIPEDDRKTLRKQAYLQEMTSEFKKGISKLLTDMVALRRLYSANASYPNSIKACSNDSLKAGLRSCGKFQKDFLQKNDFEQIIPNELAALLSQNADKSKGVLFRDPQYNQCSISDQEIIALTPQLLESTISPELIEKITSIDSPKSLDEIWAKTGSDFARLIRNHPILMAIGKDPSSLVRFFKGLKGTTNEQDLRNKFRTQLYSNENGKQLDSEIAKRCEQVISGFTSKVCSNDFNDADIDLGSFKNFERYNNSEDYPSDELVGNEKLLARNITMTEFCSPTPNKKLSISKDTLNLNSFLPESIRNETFKEFSTNQYVSDIGGLKKKLCDFSKGTKCSNKIECDLFDIYSKTRKENSPEYRLAHSEDPGINNILRSMIGNPSNLNPKTKEILIAEGILPQADGKFAERPEIPERKPDYLANVANGTINPNTGAPVSPNTTLAANTAARPRPSSTNAPVFQPNAANSATSDTQLAANDSDDQAALRRFQDGLDDRLKRMENQQAAQTQQATKLAAKSNPRAEVRSLSNERNQYQAPTPVSTVAPTESTNFIASPTSSSSQSTGGASLGKDNSRQTRAQAQANEARAQMFGARTNPSAVGGGQAQLSNENGRSPASTSQDLSKVALTINGDVAKNLEQVLNGNSANGSDLRSLIQSKQPFLFQLNNSVYDVEFNNGQYSVTFKSGNNSALASTLESMFNNSVRAQRSTTLTDLQNTVRN